MFKSRFQLKNVQRFYLHTPPKTKTFPRNQHTDPEGTKLQRGTSSVIAGMLVIGGMTYYYSKFKVDRRMTGCEYIEHDGNYKASYLKFLRYKNCILTEEMVKSGLMEKIESFETRSGDVFVASFPKSGTTWVQEIVYQLYLITCSQLKDDVNKKEKQISVNCNEIFNSCDCTMETRFPYIEHFYPGIKEIEKKDGGRLIKTHLPVHLLPKNTFESGCKVIYIYRNPKDVVVSYYHFARMLTFIMYRGKLEEFIVQFLKNTVAYAPYFPHLFGYIDKAKTSENSLLVLCYEDLLEDPKREISKIAKFLNLNLRNEDIEEVTEVTSFKVMKSNPLTNYDHWTELGLRDKAEGSFMRTGRAGDFKNHLDPEVEAIFETWMSQNLKESNKEDFHFKYTVENSASTKEKTDASVETE